MELEWLKEYVEQVQFLVKNELGPTIKTETVNRFLTVIIHKLDQIDIKTEV